MYDDIIEVLDKINNTFKEYAREGVLSFGEKLMTDDLEEKMKNVKKIREEIGDNPTFSVISTDASKLEDELKMTPIRRGALIVGNTILASSLVLMFEHSPEYPCLASTAILPLIGIMCSCVQGHDFTEGSTEKDYYNLLKEYEKMGGVIETSQEDIKEVTNDRTK